jgi:UDP-GlcNAc3NAcA epimerase
LTRVLTVIGARPQFVKAAVVSRALLSAGVSESIVHTGQHYDPAMSDIFFEEMCIPEPAHHLRVGSGTHGQQTAAMLEGIERIAIQDRPDWILVYGDTNSTLAGALAAAKLHVPLAHVEAGLRSFNRRMPEEVNRIATDHLSSLLLCPTASAVAHLQAEGVVDAPERHGFKRRVLQVGDVMYDATVRFGEIAAGRSRILESVGVHSGCFDLATIHRAENTDDPVRLAVIVEALAKTGAQRPVIWPVHPRTRKRFEIDDRVQGLASSGVRLIEPVGYLDMLMLERSARCVITDSGGVQKEAFFAGVPCVTLRDETEWMELVELGWNQVASPSLGVDYVVSRIEDARPGTLGRQPYGNGNASVLIADALLDT